MKAPPTPPEATSQDRCGLREIAELAPSYPLGLIPRRAFPHQLRGAGLEVKGELVVDILGDRPLSRRQSEKPSNSGEAAL